MFQAESFRHPVFRHVTGVEQNVDPWEQSRKVLVESFVLRRVMPAMEFWTGNQPA